MDHRDQHLIYQHDCLVHTTTMLIRLKPWIYLGLNQRDEFILENHPYLPTPPLPDRTTMIRLT